MTIKNKIKTLYYPGAGIDFSTIVYFIENSSIETFYYSDYLNRDIRPESILSQMRGQLSGYNINYIASLHPAYFNQTDWKDYWCQESDGQTFSGRKENSFISLYRIELLDKTWELFYFGTEAIETFKVLLENQVKIDLVITQDHGLGCLWTTFCKGSYLEAIARVNDKMPSYLLVGEHMPAWEGYNKISEPFGVFGVHEHPRIMYELNSQSVDFFEFKERYDWLYRRNSNSNI